MDDYQELIERLRFGNTDSETMNGAADAIESLLAENERLKHNLTTTEQTMREYQELAAKRLEEIAKYRDALINIQQVACSGSPELGIATDALIVKPGEEK